VVINRLGHCLGRIMRVLFNTWFSIAFLMGKPHDHPGDQHSVFIAVIAAVLSFILAMSAVTELSSAVGLALLDVAFAAVCLRAALQMVDRPQRFSQAFGAYCGASTVLNLASMIMLNTLTSPTSAAGGLSLATVFQFVYLVWGISMVAHILRFTFEITLPASIVSAAGYLILSMYLVGLIFPH